MDTHFPQLCDIATVAWHSIFEHPEGSRSGSSRLGISYVEASKPIRNIQIKFDGELIIFPIFQQLGSSHDLSTTMGVGAVVWDAGELLCDFLGSCEGLVRSKRVIDLGR